MTAAGGSPVPPSKYTGDRSSCQRGCWRRPLPRAPVCTAWKCAQCLAWAEVFLPTLHCVVGHVVYGRGLLVFVPPPPRLSPLFRLSLSVCLSD